MVKKLVIIFYVLIIVCMGAATIIEKYQGTEYVANNIYGSGWFAALWALGVAAGIAYFLKRKVKRLSVILLHLSFVIILLGALLTHVSSRKGIISLRKAIPTDTYFSQQDGQIYENKLPFSITLKDFNTQYHDGTLAAADYISEFVIVKNGDSIEGRVSMNKIFSYDGVRLYQNGFDEDGNGATLSMNSDPWGIPVTYIGYALLFIGLLWMLIDKQGAYRRLLRNPLLKRGTIIAACLIATGSHCLALNTFSKEVASEMGKMNVNYGDRICPLQTLALDFTKKLYGKRHYGDYSAEQVLCGFIFWGDEWHNEPIIKVKGSELREKHSLGKYCSLNDLFSNDGGGYVLGMAINDYYRGQNDSYHQQAAKIDDKLMLIMELHQGKLLKLFPFTDKDHITTWLSPTDKMPKDIEKEREEYIHNIFNIMNADAHAGNEARVLEAIKKIQRYQKVYGASSIQTPTKNKAERIYNAIPFATILFMLNLTMGFLTLFFFMYQLRGKKSEAANLMAKKNTEKWFVHGSAFIMLISLLALTLCLVLRWIVSGSVPMSNGYETMLFMAWCIMLISILIYRKFNIILTFGFLLSGFFLLVSHISQMDPQISHLMPVLSSPLLTIHVSIIMMAYALLSLTFICGLMAIVVSLIMPKDNEKRQMAIVNYQLLSKLFLYPSITCLGFGIFIGAIWANISWGTYWSWDPKETWALITLMIYAVPLHGESLPWLRKPMAYHIYMTLAFLSILMTYFGVNYFLGGMHSYA